MEKEKENNDRNRKNKMDCILKHGGDQEAVSWKIYFFNDGDISEKDRGRRIHRVCKPLPGEKPCNKKEGIIFDLNLHDHLKGDKKYQGKGEWVSNGPQIPKEGAFISNLHLLLGEHGN